MSTAGTKASADPSTALGMTTAREALEQELVAWLNERFAPDGPLIHADTLLFSSGLLDSLRILELIAWTERAIGREIPDRAIRTDNFASAARIAGLFAAGGPDAHR
jgi:acyl carrier protein